MAFSETERTALRRFCGYPAYGAGTAGFQNWRFYQAYGLLEYRLNFLTGSEEAVARRYVATLETLETAVPAASAVLAPQNRIQRLHATAHAAALALMYSTIPSHAVPYSEREWAEAGMGPGAVGQTRRRAVGLPAEAAPPSARRPSPPALHAPATPRRCSQSATCNVQGAT